MDASAANWLSDLLLQETQECNLFRQCHLNLLDDNLQQPLSSESYSSNSQTLRNSSTDETTLERPTKQLKPLSPKQNKTFPVSPPQPGNVNFTRKESTQNQNSETKSPKVQGSHAQDHIMAERKRREKLSQSLIALAALIPGLKKMDKASVLGDAIKYVKELQERLRSLEEQRKNRDVESVVMINKPHLRCYDDHSSSRDDDV